MNESVYLKLVKITIKSNMKMAWQTGMEWMKTILLLFKRWKHEHEHEPTQLQLNFNSIQANVKFENETRQSRQSSYE